MYNFFNINVQAVSREIALYTNLFCIQIFMYAEKQFLVRFFSILFMKFNNLGG